MLEFMKKKILIPSLIILGIAGFLAFKTTTSEGKTTTDERKSLVLTTVMKALQEGHFSPRPLDDSFSLQVWTKFLEQLDYEKKFFTAAEIQKLKAYQFSIDEELKKGNATFFKVADPLFQSTIERAEKFSGEILKTPFTFTAPDSVLLAGDKLDYAAGVPELKQRWERYLKYRVLAKYVDLKDAQEKDSTGAKKKSDAELEAESRTAIGKNQDLLFRRLRKLDESQRFAIFVNSITGSEDPHTDYFPPKDKERFDEAMSGSFSGIGAQLQQKDGKIEITAIIAGSPSWKQGELKANDEILKVGQGTEEPVDVEGWDLEDVVSKIRGAEGTQVRLTVKRVDGSQRVIAITRGEVLMEETFAKSELIEGPNGPIGYITLPEFYADFRQRNGRRSGTDVAIEVEKLKEAGAKGIIFDLRNNGGGSLSDVVDIAGLFIGKGAIVQVKSSDAAPMTLRDNDANTLYDGPLVVMVNNGSASASEIMAAALQDYGRALIVGTNTFGKGTVQKVIGLEEVLDPITRMKLGASKEPPLGALKITMQKFYRVDGGSTQRKGVTPDVIIPDAYELLENLGESRDKAALPWDRIAALPIERSNKALPISMLAQRSKARIASNGAFQIIQSSAQKLKARENGHYYPLSEVAYRTDLKEGNALSKQLEELEKAGHPLKIYNLKADEAKINLDTTTVAKNKAFLKLLQKDIYLSEAVNIMNDLAGKSVGSMTPKEPRAVKETIR
jgi:carboxyl-terminal processing protease